MTTQSLRGMANHGPMHWRGDRTGGNDPGGDSARRDAAFKKFNVAFPGLLGRGGPLPDTEMQAFADFILEVTYPPNPIRALDNSLTADEAAGRDFFIDVEPVGRRSRHCNGCHSARSGAAASSAATGSRASSSRRRSSRSRTCATCTRRSACSACRRSPSSTPATTATRAIRCAASASCTTAASTPSSASTTPPCSTRTTRAACRSANPGGFPNGAAGDPQAPAGRVVHARLRQQPRPDRRPAGDARRGRGRRAAARRCWPPRCSSRTSPVDDESRRKIVVQTKDPAVAIPIRRRRRRSALRQPIRAAPSRRSIMVASADVRPVAYVGPRVRQLDARSDPSDAPTGYKYRDAELDNGTVKTLIWKSGKLLKAVFKGKGVTALTYDLQPVSVRARWTSSCAAARTASACSAGRSDGHDGSDGRKFLGKGSELHGAVAVPVLRPGRRRRCSGGDAAHRSVRPRAQVTRRPECDLVVKGTLDGEARGWYYRPALEHLPERPRRGGAAHRCAAAPHRRHAGSEPRPTPVLRRAPGSPHRRRPRRGRGLRPRRAGCGQRSG